MILAIDTTDRKEIKELSHQVSQVRAWMLRSYGKHLLPDGRVDVERMAGQAQWEYGIDAMTAENLAAQVAAEVDD